LGLVNTVVGAAAVIVATANAETNHRIGDPWEQDIGLEIRGFIVAAADAVDATGNRRADWRFGVTWKSQCSWKKTFQRVVFATGVSAAITCVG